MKFIKKSQRKCIICGIKTDKEKLIRIVKTPKNKIEIDHTGKKLGRGIYFCFEKKCLNNIIKKKYLNKNLEIKINDDIKKELNYLINN